MVKLNELDKEQLTMLHQTFDAFDVDRKGYIGIEMIGTILDMLGTQLAGDELDSVISEIDEDGNGEVNFEEFANLAARFLGEEDEDTEAIQLELKGAFRLYDRDGNGFITTEVLREILRELDDKLSDDDLDNMIDEIDADGSGTVDWEVLKTTFDGFDVDKKGNIPVDMIGQILDMLGHQLTAEELQAIVSEIDEDGNGEMSFEEFAHLAARFLVEEEEDTEAILRELKDAFRLYDKEGLGFITTDLLREILKELDEKVTPSDLDQMIEEIDIDGSGTVDWEEFKAMMIG
nr:troponin C, isotype alpha-like isoform X2 [Onthophagus taurus]